MPTTDSKLTSMEDHHTVEDEERGLTDVSSSAIRTTPPLSTPLFQTITRPNCASETVIENKAVSMANTDCSSTLPSPVEASPAKPDVTPTTIEGTNETSPAASCLTSASESQTCTGTSLVSISESQSLPSCALPSTTFGSPDLENDFPAVLTFKGVSVTLENNSVWKQFNSCGTEMILTKQGRRMFPYCRYRLAGLDPERLYNLVLSIVPSDQNRYRWSTSKWEVTGPAEHQAQGLIRAFSHHYSPCKGSEWMGGLVSFYKLKLTNNSQDQDGHIILHSMHRYIPRLHVIPVPDGVVQTSGQPVVMGPESMTFTFPQTEFMAVTTYQNFRITQLKINHNPFAKGFREDGNNSRLSRVATEPQRLVKMETQPSVLKPAELSDSKEEVLDLSMNERTVSPSIPTVQETRLVLKPIMSTSANKDEPYVPCIRGKHALGELVLVQKRPRVEPKEENHPVSLTPELQQGFKPIPGRTSMTPAYATSTPRSSFGYRKRRKRINRRWANSRGREFKAASAFPVVVHSPSLTVAMQPELDHVEGLLFVSFATKEALDVHVRDKPANISSSVSPVSRVNQMQLKEAVEVNPETDEEKIARLETILLQDLRVLKHRQVIHPVLQEVGLKLSSLDPTKSIDLQYLGVHLPLPPPNLQRDSTTLSRVDEGSPFISRTGKTCDMTKIKGWRNKFIRSKEAAPNCDGLQKNLSAFCSNMLDEYLETEAQQISERAAAFSTNPEGSVAYQLPAKSSSYVKTLDSVLKHRKTVSRFVVGANRPCPLSHKPLLYSALTSPPPLLASPATADQAEAQSMQQSTSPHTQPGTASDSAYASSVSQKLPKYHQRVSQKPTFGQNQGISHRPSGLTKFQFKLTRMEMGAINQGLNRTQLTPDRLSVALSVILTKEMVPSQVLKVAQYSKCKAVGPECGQEFCRLGCVCSSLEHPIRGPLHCRRPECMFGCACFKRKITKQTSVGESDHQIQPVYSVTNMEYAMQPRPGSHANKLWSRNIHDEDADPVFIPETPQCLVVSKAVKRSSVTRPTQPIREEDKDPVYKYLESMMTCARVREFNSKPPVITMEPNMPDTSTANTITKQQKTTTDNLPKQYYRTLTTVRNPAENTSQESSEKEARKQIQIQSACEWSKDRKMVLDALCRRMNQNKLSQRFCLGPYRIRPLTKIFMRKPSGSIVTYRIHISKQSKANVDSDVDEFDDSDEEKHTNENFNGDIDAEEDDDQIEESEMQLGVTPFLSGVLPAGRLRARTKPLGCQAYGLIQVNGKSYNQARLLLGNMGSLHPANRLAAYITGRLNAPGKVFQKNSQKPDPTQNNNIQGTLPIKAAGTVVPPIITARKTTDLKTPAQQPGPLFQPDSWRKETTSLLQHLQKNSSTINPVQSLVSIQQSSISPFQKGSTTSPVSLTVSPSLKTPSFLGQSGTYSFRICPPTNQSTSGQNLPGVTLPGGFTLIQLPKPGADGAEKQSDSVNMTNNTGGIDKSLQQKDALLNFEQSATANSNWPGSDTCKSVEPGSSFELKCNEKMPSDESDETNSKHVASNLDIASEDMSSSSSDYCGEDDEDEETVDIETVEEIKQGITIAKMKKAVSKTLQESQYYRDSSDDFGSVRECDIQDQVDNDESKGNTRRRNHVALERQRRSEQRTLFDKLQTVLQSDPRSPRLRLLSLALKEIRNLVETSKYLEEQKKSLIQLQSLYMKQLSVLSGKSESLIKHKVKEICERQKIREKTMKWKPYFSHLLQSRAALLQAITPQEQLESTAQFKPDFFMAPLQNVAVPYTTASLNNVQQIMAPPQPNLFRTPAQSSAQTYKITPRSLPKALSSPAQTEATASTSEVENQQGEPVTLCQVDQHQLKFKEQEGPRAPAHIATPISQSQAPTVIGKVNAGSYKSSTPKSYKLASCLPKPFTLPLIRSKTGRIILPSSLKPIGQGFYTLTVMKPKKNGEEDESSSSANTQPPDVDTSKNQEKSFSASDQPSDSENSHILEEDKTTSSNFDPKHSGETTLLNDVATRNKSTYASSIPLKVPKNSQEGGTVAGLGKTQATACLSFNCMRQVPGAVEAEPDPSPPVVRRPRGRPRKNPLPLVNDSKKHAVVEETRKSTETIILVKERRNEKNTLEVTKTQAINTPLVVSKVADNPVPVKRRRGRPPKRKIQLCSPPVAQAESSSSKSNEDSPVRLSCSNKKLKASPAATKLVGDIKTSRPLTRGALGKDFPSEKKRSWIDVERELEPELESE